MTEVIHKHEVIVGKTESGKLSFVKFLAAPIFLAAAVVTVIKTDGEYKEINCLVPGFAFLCIWKTLF